MSVKEKIANFVESLRAEHQLMPYAYNVRDRDFQPGKDTVYYSGPVWNDDEVSRIRPPEV